MRHVFEQLWLDCRYALRRLYKSPMFAAVATLSLALGIGANVAIFSLANAVMLKVLPVQEPHRLVQLTPGETRPGNFFTNPIWEEIRDRNDLFDGAFAWSLRRFNLTSRGETDTVPGFMASGDFFEVLGVRAIVGRTFTRADDQRGGGADGPVAVISYGYWQSRYAGARDVLGKSIALDGHEFTIIGVTPPAFFGVEIGQSFNIAVPLSADALLKGDQTSLDRRNVWWLKVMARLKAGQRAEEALAALRAAQPGIREATLPPQSVPDEQRNYLARPFGLVEAPSGTSSLRVRHRTTLFVLLGIVSLVLLIACANLANLLLARASARRHEIAVRMAIGASRVRLISQLLTESLVLSFLGAALGLAFAHWASRLLVYQLSSRTSHVALDLSLDWRVWTFTTAVAFVTALLFGIAPALRSTDKRTHTALHNVRSVAAVGSRFHLEKLFTVVQIAVSLMLVFGASLFVRSFTALLTVDSGFDRQNLLVVSLDLQRTMAPPDQRPRIFDQVLESVRAVPGVESAAATVFAPLSGAWSEGPVEVPGFEAMPARERLVYFNTISEDYFRTLGVSFFSGRDFTRADSVGAARVAIVNDAFARKFFDRSDPVGKSFKLAEIGATQIVGSVGDTKYRNLREPPPPTVFLPGRQRGEADAWLHLVIRGRADLASLTSGVGAAITRVNENIAFDPRTLARDVDDSLIQERLMATLSGFFGALALLLASIGLYGLMSLAITRRQREIGVRLALGAPPGAVFWLMLRDVAIVTTVGVVVGSAAALLSARFVSGLVFGLEPTDVPTLMLAVAVLGATATVAGYLPARRAARLNPATVLHGE